MLKLYGYYAALGAIFAIIVIGQAIARKFLYPADKEKRRIADGACVILGLTLEFLLLTYLKDKTGDLLRELDPTGMQRAILCACWLVPPLLAIIIGILTGLYKRVDIIPQGPNFVETDTARIDIDDPDEMRKNMDKL